MTQEIVNRVEESGIVTLDLEVLIPEKEVVEIDIAPQLSQGLILREKDFRGWVKDNDWSIYEGKRIALHCSVDAIVPTWAYMLVANALREYTLEIYFANLQTVNALIAERLLSTVSPDSYEDKRVVIKGCGDREISNHAYVMLTSILLPVAKTIMYGEPCSTVPVYKKRK